MSLLLSLTAIDSGCDMTVGAYPRRCQASKLATSAVRLLILSVIVVGLKSTISNLRFKVDEIHLKLLSSSVIVKGYPLTERNTSADGMS